MLSPQLRQKVFNLWTMFWTSGMTNPLVAIEQITYLLFLKQLESLDAQRMDEGKPSIYGPRPDCDLPHPVNTEETNAEEDGTEETNMCSGHKFCRWSVIVQDPTHDLFSQYVFPWLRKLDDTFVLLSQGEDQESIPLGQGIMADAYFQFPRDKAATLQKAIKAIDELFPQSTTQSNDLMGDIFEYLLSEIQTSGKNGQFRTPRHIIRFMVELLNPQPGEKVIDPAAGTGGFLFSTIQYLLKKVTPSEDLRLEADGTPHRLLGGDPAVEKFITGEYFTGYDNDRTMVRVGWMNLILHGVENPRMMRRDSLGKSFPAEESSAYKIVLANPPFTGSVDADDLHESRFPKKGSKPLTTKSELLFVWLILDLLETGGRAAVIVPEGVLFGSYSAHSELRRQLLFEHHLQAVISLPAGVFQPYAGVKTSILIFQKVGVKPKPGDDLRTQKVWFYEVLADGYTLDAKRDHQPENNDLWDAQAKYEQEGGPVAESLNYYKPEAIFTERWRLVDADTVKIFPKLEMEQGKTWGIHELFPELPSEPQEAESHVVTTQTPVIESLYRRYVLAQLTANASVDAPLNKAKARRILNDALRKLRTMFKNKEKARWMLDTEFERYGLKALDPCCEDVEIKTEAVLEKLLDQANQAVASSNGETAEDDHLPQTELTDNAPTTMDWQSEVNAIVREFAKLDGFDVKLRSFGELCESDVLEESHCWVAPVRAYARDDDWENEDGTLHGTHDEHGQVRPEYIATLTEQNVFDDLGMVKSEYLDDVLDPECIEANDLNLSAGRYKPFVLEMKGIEPPEEILRAVRQLEQSLATGIDELLDMVKGAK